MQELHSFDTETESPRIVKKQNSKGDEISKQKRYIIAGISILAILILCNYAISPSKKHKEEVPLMKPLNAEKVHQPVSLSKTPIAEHKGTKLTHHKANFALLGKQRNKAHNAIL